MLDSKIFKKWYSRSWVFFPRIAKLMPKGPSEANFRKSNKMKGLRWKLLT